MFRSSSNMDMESARISKPWYKFALTSFIPLRIKNPERKTAWKTPRKISRSNPDIKVSVITGLI